MFADRYYDLTGYGISWIGKSKDIHETAIDNIIGCANGTYEARLIEIEAELKTLSECAG